VSAARSVSTNHSPTRQVPGSRKGSRDRRSIHASSPKKTSNRVTFISNKPLRVQTTEMDKKELFASKRFSSCRSVDQLDEYCAAFNAEIRRVDSFIAKHGPVVEVDCLSESAASPTKVPGSARKINAKGLLTERNASSTSAFSHNLTMSAAENEELNQDMKARVQAMGQLHYKPSEENIHPAAVANHYAGLNASLAQSKADRAIFKCKKTMEAVSNL